MDSFKSYSWTPQTNMENPMYKSNNYPKNKYVFFKQANRSNVLTTPTILVNPHFKDNTKVYFNPKFSVNRVSVAPKPTIHVNPYVIKTVSSTVIPNSCTSVYSKSISTNVRSNVLLSTKNKLIKLPEIKSNLTQKSISPLVSCVKSTSLIKNELNKKIVATRTKIVNASIQNTKRNNATPRRSSINTRFKYISSSGLSRKSNRHIIKSKHKIVNNSSNSNKLKHNSHIQSSVNNTRKRYIFVNKFNSSSFLANNVIFKNRKINNFVNINGILYRNTSCRLRKYPNNKFQTSVTLTNKNTPHKIQRISIHKKRTSDEKEQVSRHKKLLKNMKKSNVPCPIYKRFGRCSGQKNGTCIKIHNPEQIILCPRFLQGTCIKKSCPLSHKVSAEKMPTCKYFLEGLCSKDDCQYLHVKISPKADICKEFLEGFCKAGTKCEKRHQFLCPDFEKTGKCPKRRCQYPHKYLKATLGKTATSKINRKYIGRKKLDVKEIVSEKSKIRYYDEEMGNEEKTGESSGVKRPKLGVLPSFIPLDEL